MADAVFTGTQCHGVEENRLNVENSIVTTFHGWIEQLPPFPPVLA